jgi:molybdopterin synthase sulfur carrier subunit
MAVVWIPSLMRDLTAGEAKLSVQGETVRQVIQKLEQRYPGMEARLCAEGRLRPNISVVVDGTASSKGLRHKLNTDSEVHFLPAMSGG